MKTQLFTLLKTSNHVSILNYLHLRNTIILVIKSRVCTKKIIILQTISPRAALHVHLILNNIHHRKNNLPSHHWSSYDIPPQLSLTFWPHNNISNFLCQHLVWQYHIPSFVFPTHTPRFHRFSSLWKPQITFVSHPIPLQLKHVTTSDKCHFRILLTH